MARAAEDEALTFNQREKSPWPKTLQVELDLPRDMLGTLDVPENELGPHLKKLIALELFREERISSGKAAELLGFSKSEFIDVLDQHGIAFFTETPEELASQVQTVQEKRSDQS